jgi:4-carboxymuconolactone decarboxylase
MKIVSAASRASVAAPAANFTGAVTTESIARNTDGSRVIISSVTFAPGARTTWHAHHERQVLIVTTGTGIVQVKGEAARLIVPGDVIDIPKGVVHWHGAAENSLMHHHSVLEADGPSTDWMEAVTPNDYKAANEGARKSKN